MSHVDTHVVRTERIRSDSTWTRWACTCGRRSKWFGFPGNAAGAAQHHATATGGRFETTPGRRAWE